ncbi:hypothetical protein F5X98DRAFT_335609 [Xylaria grammica]|nr:hypothetical protein F5X98DRAFT_335609 [Xylaria grammica]
MAVSYLTLELLHIAVPFLGVACSRLNISLLGRIACGLLITQSLGLVTLATFGRYRMASLLIRGA